MRGLGLLLALVLVSNVIAEAEMTNEEMKTLLKIYQEVANKMTKDVLEMEKEEEKIVGKAKADFEKRDTDSESGLAIGSSEEYPNTCFHLTLSP